MWRFFEKVLENIIDKKCRDFYSREETKNDGIRLSWTCSLADSEAKNKAVLEHARLMEQIAQDIRDNLKLLNERLPK